MAEGEDWRPAQICPECREEAIETSMHKDAAGKWHARCIVCLSEVLDVRVMTAKMRRELGWAVSDEEAPRA